MFSSHFRIEKQQKRRLDLEQSAPSPQRKLASALSSHGKGVSCRKLGLKLNCMWCFNCQRHLGLQGGRHNNPQEKEGPCSLSSPGKEETNAWSSFRSITGGMVQDLKSAKCPSQLRPVEHFLGSLKQVVYAGSWEASNIDQLTKRDHLEVKDIDVGLLRNTFRGFMTKVRHAANNGVLTVLLIAHLFLMATLFVQIKFFSSAPYLHFLKYAHSKFVQFFTAQALREGITKVSPNADVPEFIRAVKMLIRGQRNTLLDQIDFYNRQQDKGESFDSFYAALRELYNVSDFSDLNLCQRCSAAICGQCKTKLQKVKEDMMRDRIVTGALVMMRYDISFCLRQI